MAVVTYRTENTWQLQPPYLPLDKLQKHTNTYLRKVGGSTPSEKESHLALLVNDHSAKDVAIVACPHTLPSVVVRHINTANQLNILSYLKALVGVQHANPSAVNGTEKECAQTLITLSLPNVLDTMDRLWQFSGRMNEFLSLTDAANLLPPRIVYSIPQMTCRVFSGQLQDLIYRHQWRRAHQATSSLSRTFGTASVTGQLLDSFLPDWRMWAAWRPDARRLNAWEQLTSEQRQELADYLSTLRR